MHAKFPLYLGSEIWYDESRKDEEKEQYLLDRLSESHRPL